jgi:hydrogenase maturation protein HypF
MHNRDIYNRCDDSVTQIVQGKELIIRRSRGYAPFPIRVNFNLKPTLAVGAELKNTFCLAKRNLAFISQHIGDLRNLETLEFFKEAIKRYKRLFLIEPEIIAYDLHPDYLSTKFAKEYSSYNTCFSLLPVQHHHAHIASCMAENGLLNEEVIGVAWDGIGYGTDGKIWGGEFMLASYSHFERVGHFKYIPMPGADKATEEPYRMGISYLYSVFGKDFINLKLDFIQRLNKQKVDILLRMIDLGINSPLTSSVGRLFDAVSAILGVCDKVDYEAQAAVELEMLIKDEVIEEYKYEIILDNDIFIINPSFIIEGIIRDIVDKIPSFIISCKFHNTLVSIIEKMCVKLREKYKLNKVVLSGGVFQNRYLIEKLLPRLKALGFICFRHSKVPPNDGGISLGQVVIANHKDVLGNTSRDN